MLCQPARIPQLQHRTLKVKHEAGMKLLIYLVAQSMQLVNYHFHFFLMLLFVCPHDFEIQVFS